SNYSYSSSTYRTYTHYDFNFPSQELKPKLSGNYILKVYRNYDAKDVIITRRFMVINQTFIVTGLANSATNPEFRFKKQEIDFEVNYASYNIPNPMMDVTAVVLQNQRWDNAIFDLKPRFINQKVLSYNYEQGNLFNGGNEFRYFDIRSLRFLSFNVRRKYIDENNTKNVVLYNDGMKGHQPYLQTIDYNGKRVIDNRDGNNGELEGDYCLVHFTLISDKLDKDVYIFGELTDWQMQDSFKMEYNEGLQQYEKVVLLKQAMYNYYYVTQSDNPLENVDISETEGNFFNTENDYNVLIYHKNQFMKYDELLGSLHLNSARK
ncbi:MAG: DUF5103 domain-containing protein, partial [Bacteroidia bacterium]|nr:DUF5103 domain-containing protein [Bacteroidia bacterium]